MPSNGGVYKQPNPQPWHINPLLTYPYDTRLHPMPAPEVGIFDCPVVHICVNASWASHINGLMDRLLYTDAWDGTDEEKERAIGEIEKLLASMKVRDMCCCGGSSGTPTNQRWTDDWIGEQSFDNGATWQQSPALNEGRFNGAFWPPLPGANGDIKKCQAANSFVTFMIERQQKDLQLKQLGADVAEFANAIIGMLVGLGVITGGFTAILALIGAALAALFANWSAAEFEGDFTEEVWSNLLCCAFCNMENDASFTLAGWQQMQSDVTMLIGGRPGDWCNVQIKAMGTVGATNAARAGRAGSRTCNLCECSEWCYTWDLTQSQYGWIIRLDGAQPYGRYVPEVGFKQNLDWSVYDSTGFYITFPLANVTSATMNFDPALSGGNPRMLVYLGDWDADTISLGGGTQQTADFDRMLTRIGFDLDPAVNAKQEWTGTAVRITLTGRGANPFGISNCGE